MTIREALRTAAALAALTFAHSAAAATDAACKLVNFLEFPVTMHGLRPVVSAQIGGKDAQFILDSGAFFSSMSRASAAQYGLRLEPLPANINVHGIGGAVAGMAQTRVRDFAIGGITLPGVTFIVGGTDVGLIGLLGQNFLHLADVEYDLPHGAVRLIRAAGCKGIEQAYWAKGRPVTLVPLEQGPTLSDNHTTAMILLNGVKLRAVFDSGAPTSIMTLAAAKRAGLTPESPDVTRAGFESGLGKATTPSWLGTFKTIDIGGEKIANPRIRFADIQLGFVDILIGADFFLTHRMFVSNKQGKMYLTYEGGPVFGLTPKGAVTDTGARIDLADAGSEPTDAEGFARRGAVAASKRQFEAAIPDFDKAIALAPKEARYLLQRAFARLALRQLLLAAGDVDKAIALDPDNIDAHGTRATLRLALHDPDGAVEDLRVLDRVLPPTARQRLAVANMADAAGQTELALTNFTAWLNSHVDDAARPVALNGRCWARAQLNRELDGALNDCNQALRARPNAAGYLDSRALVRFRQGNFAAALADYNAALAANPKLGWSLYARGLVKAKLGDAAGAKADRDAALAIDPRSPERARKWGLESEPK